jgi:hypothetical protein
MKLHKLLSIQAALLAVLATPMATQAQTTVYHFGGLISGDGAPVEIDFATLSATVSGSDVLFTLDAQGLDLFDGTQPFIGALSIDGDKVGGIGNVSGDTSVKMAKGGGPNGGWEFRFDLTGKKKDRLTDDESVSWTWIGGAGHFTGIGAHVQGLDYGNTTSAWYQTLAVPEPGTYAMFLAGLGVLGVAALRRRRLGG